MRKVYADNNATTPVRAEVIEAMSLALTDQWGNPSSIHWAGRDAHHLVEQAREQVARFLAADPSEVVFTSGGSESDNIAIKGTVRKYAHKGKHIITTAVEHPAVLETCRHLESNGHPVTYLSVDGEGMINLDEYRNSFRDDTVIVTVMTANNETGVVFPVKEMAQIAAERGVIFHTDAVQAAGKIPIDVRDLNVDLLSISGHKMYAPKGIGALYVRGGVRVENLIHGGGHEWGMRAGTENVPGIVALGKACELAASEFPELESRLSRLRDKLEEGVKARIDDVHINGHPTRRTPNTVNVSFDGVEGESVLLSLDLEGVAASTGSACSTEEEGPSHVLNAMGISPQRANGAVRFSLGRDNTEDDIDYILDVLPPIIKRLRSISPLYRHKQSGVDLHRG